MLRASNLVVVVFLALALACAGMAGCASVFGFADRFTEAEGGPDTGEGGAPTYNISGSASGATGASLTLNDGVDGLVLTMDGFFAFHAKLGAGASYKVVVGKAPSKKTCGIMNGSGTVGSADVTNVQVNCLSTDASLTSLTLSAATLSSMFVPGTVDYKATAKLAVAEPTSTTVTATTADAAAKLTINGANAMSGVPSAPISLAPGQITIKVVVDAPSGATATYTIVLTATIGETYVKASNTGTGNGRFGQAVALSSDGATMAIGAPGDPSSATGVNGVQSGNGAPLSGAVYVFTRASSGTWSQQAYIKASNTRQTAGFGSSVALSGDGNTLAVGSPYESSNAKSIGGDQNDMSAMSAGAVYVFTRSSMLNWSQQAYVKASNTAASYMFGGAVALSSTGDTLAVGATGESSSTNTIGGSEVDTSAMNAGAAYVYLRSGSTWAEQAYVKPSNNRAGALFGADVALSGDGNTLIVGAPRESSNATGVGGNQSDTSDSFAGAAYVFSRMGALWSQQSYVKPSNTRPSFQFGEHVAISTDGSTCAVGAAGETSNALGINGSQSDTSAVNAGAAYVFARAGASWSQQAYVKSSNTRASAFFGSALSFSSDGSVLAVGAYNESSNAIGVGGNQSDTSAPGAGAAYLYKRAAMTWSQVRYVKATNTRTLGAFGLTLAVSGDGQTFVAGAAGDSSNATGIDGNGADTSASNAGAAYVFP